MGVTCRTHGRDYKCYEKYRLVNMKERNHSGDLHVDERTILFDCKWVGAQSTLAP